MTVLEHEVEARLLVRCREMGFLCMKFTSPGRAGVPDRVVVTPTGTVFVETKRPGGKLRRLQEEVTEKMRRAGAEVHVVDSISGVDELVESLATRSPRRCPVDDRLADIVGKPPVLRRGVSRSGVQRSSQ